MDSRNIANALLPTQCTHPGEFLREELESRGLSQTLLAKEMGMSLSLLNELINGKRDFTIEYSLMIEAALGIDADFWMNQQMLYNKVRASHDQGFMTKLANIRKIVAAL